MNKSEYPTYIHIGYGEHWIKCKQVFGSNYVPIDKFGTDCRLEDCDCVVCGHTSFQTKRCAPRDF